MYSLEDLIKAAKYAYEYRDTTQFPDKSFEDNCENNLKQMLQYWSSQKTKEKSLGNSQELQDLEKNK